MNLLTVINSLPTGVELSFLKTSDGWTAIRLGAVTKGIRRPTMTEVLNLIASDELKSADIEIEVLIKELRTKLER